MRAALLVLAVGLGCFDPHLGDAPFTCGPGGSCPTGYECAGANLCLKKGGSPEGRADAAAIDASRVSDADPLRPDALQVSCEPGAVVRCVDAHTALVCADDGEHAEEQHCAEACSEASGECLQCKPGSQACEEDKLVQCAADGSAETVTPCPLGCDATRCAVLTPSNVDPLACETTPVRGFDVDGFLQIDTGGCEGGEIVGPAGAQVCYVRLSDVRVRPGGMLRVFGPYPLVVVADTVKLEGAVLAGARLALDGPGTPAADTAGGSVNLTTALGGGGAGHYSDGAHGGAGGGSFGAPGGPHYGDESLEPLQPGGRGGAGGAPPCPAMLRPIIPVCPAGTVGGGAGGAIRIVACERFTIVEGAIVDAGGGGGAGGNGTLALDAFGGGGGGSGGSILLEAPMIDVPGGAAITANGGGGGAGGSKSGGVEPGPMGGNGEDGHAGEAGAALGGVPGDDHAGGGGRGAALEPPGPGGGAPVNGNGTGGGGGAPGRIRLNVRKDREPRLGDAVISPPPSVGQVKAH